MIAEVVTDAGLAAEVQTILPSPVSGLEQYVLSMPLETEEHHQRLCEYERELAETEQKIRAVTEPAKKKAADAHAATCNVHNTFVPPVERARKLAKQRIAEYRDRVAAEQERLQLLAASSSTSAAEDEALSLAASLENDGHGEAAEQVLSSFSPSPLVLASRPLATHGVTIQKRWKAEVTDKKALLAFVLANYETHGHLVEPVGKELNVLAQSYKDKLSKAVPGLKGVSKSC